MKKLFYLCLMLVALMPAMAANGSDSLRSKDMKIYTFPLEGEINASTLHRVEKAMEEASELKSDLIIVRINTFGGELESADKIRTHFLQSEIPVWAYINNNAASAGALISIACDSIFMHSGSSIGAASVVDQKGEVLPDKYQSYMRSLMRTTAETRGRRADIAEAMVDPDVFVAGISDSGKVLTFTTTEAVENHYCEAEVETLEELLAHAHVKKYTIQEQHYSWIGKVVGFLVNPVVSALLIMLIIGGIYFELQQPGIGFPLLMAVLAALLYFAPLYLEGLAANWEILLFVIGVALLAVELFVIPGFGIAGIGGIICIVAGLVCSLIGNVGFDFSHVPEFQLSESLLVVVLSVTVSIPLAVWLGKKLFEGEWFGGLALESTQEAAEGYTVLPQEDSSLIGCRGETLTILRPSGKVLINGKSYDSMSRFGYIEPGTPVEVADIENATLIVNKIEE